VNTNMKLSYDYQNEKANSIFNENDARTSLINETVIPTESCINNENFQSAQTEYNYAKYETKVKITQWKSKTDSSIEVMYMKMTESLSIGKITMMATTLVILILICIYGYRRQRHRAERRQIEMVWVKVRHSLFV